jgi:hypothetical protein
MNMLTPESALKLLGKRPGDVARELADFSASARVFSTDHPRLIDEHPQQWVGVYKGRVEAAGKTMKSVLSQLREKGVPKDETIVRFIDREEKTLIL